MRLTSFQQSIASTICTGAICYDKVTAIHFDGLILTLTYTMMLCRNMTNRKYNFVKFLTFEKPITLIVMSVIDFYNG